MAGFATFDAVLRLHDAWDTTLYNGVCFEGHRWNLLVDDGSLSKLPWSGGRRPAPKGFKASAFQRFPIQLRQVSSKTEALRAVVDSIEFDNLLNQRATSTWYAMRDGETLRAQLAIIVDLIRTNL